MVRNNQVRVARGVFALASLVMTACTSDGGGSKDAAATGGVLDTGATGGVATDARPVDGLTGGVLADGRVADTGATPPDARVVDTSVTPSDARMPDARISDAHVAADLGGPDAAVVHECPGPNPAGCVSTGCADGFFCNTDPAAGCAPSGCACDTSTGSWGCTADCNGGICEPPAQGCPGPNPVGCLSPDAAPCPEGQYCSTGPDTCASGACDCDEGTGMWLCTPDCGGGECRPIPADTQWYLTCGDPACRGHVADPNIPPCDAAMTQGSPCAAPGTLCDPGDACNAHLLCTDTDPRMQPGGCPISKRSFKDDIHYLSPAAVGERYQALLGVKLAEYRYKTEAPGGTPHLGFIIDDGVPAEALRASHDQVDLYGYTTLTVAAIQSQAREIEALKAEVAELRALLKAKGVGGH